MNKYIFLGLICLLIFLATAIVILLFFKDKKNFSVLNKKENMLLADADNDGLTDYEEIFFYGTDPLNPDTDGDGYKDIEELSKGYNPLGVGFYEKTVTKNKLLELVNHPLEMNRSDKKRKYVGYSPGYSFEIPAGWVYESGSSYKHTFNYQDNPRLKFEIKMQPLSYISNFFPDKKEADIKISDLDKFYNVVFSENADIKQKSKFSIKNGTGYAYIDTEGRNHYLVRLKIVRFYNEAGNIKNIEEYYAFSVLNNSITLNYPLAYNDLDQIVKSLRPFGMSEIGLSLEFKKNNPEVTMNMCYGLREVFNWDRCFNDLAIKMNNDLYCDFIQPQKSKNSCQAKINNFEQECRGISCFMEFAILRGDINYCHKIHIASEKNKCVSHLAANEKNQSYCDILNDFPKNKNLCLESVAFAKTDKRICFYIDNEDIKNKCFGRIGIAKKDLEICQMITNDKKEYKTKCFIQAAIYYNDENICKNLENQATMENCVNYVNSSEKTKERYLKYTFAINSWD